MIQKAIITDHDNPKCDRTNNSVSNLMALGIRILCPVSNEASNALKLKLRFKPLAEAYQIWVLTMKSYVHITAPEFGISSWGAWAFYKGDPRHGKRERNERSRVIGTRHRDTGDYFELRVIRKIVSFRRGSVGCAGDIIRVGPTVGPRSGGVSNCGVGCGNGSLVFVRVVIWDDVGSWRYVRRLQS